MRIWSQAHKTSITTVCLVCKQPLFFGFCVGFHTSELHITKSQIFFWGSIPPNPLSGEGALKPLFQAHPLLHHCQWHYGKVIETLHNHTCVVVELKNMKALIHACR